MLHTTRVTRMLVVMIIAVFAAANVDAKILKGTVKTKMASIKAIKKNGSPDPAMNKACHDKYHSWLGKVATTKYDINTTTKMMSASVMFEGQTYDLSALGIASSYSFGKFFNPPQNDIYAVLFSLSLSGKSPVNSFGVVLNAETNCIVSSSTNPFKTAPAAKFGGE